MTNLHETAQRWVEDQYGDDQFREATLHAYAASLRMFALFPTTPNELEDVTTEHVNQWKRAIKRRINPRTGEPITAATIYNRLAALRSFFRWAVVEEQLIESNPMDRVKSPRLPKSTMQKHLEAFEVKRALASAPQRTKVMVLLAVQLGMRRGEIARLSRADITLDEERTGGMLKVREGKGGHSRNLPLHQTELIDVLVPWLDGLDPDERWVFPSRKDSGGHLKPEYVGQLVSKVTAGQGRATHAYRHTAAVDVLRRSGGDVHAVKKMLGHANLQTTQRYLDQSTDDLAEVMDGRFYGGDAA